MDVGKLVFYIVAIRADYLCLKIRNLVSVSCHHSKFGNYPIIGFRKIVALL